MWKLPFINGKMYRKLAIKHIFNEGFDEIIQLNGGFSMAMFHEQSITFV